MRLPRLALLICGFALLGGQSLAAPPESGTPEILVTALHGMQWQVRYDFLAEVRQFRFVRSPDDSRVLTWLPDEGFEIVQSGTGEVARRKDGASFRSVRFRMSPRYSVLPQDYAPFSPFSDGGMLFHSGRFFACADPCAEHPTWSMSLWAATEDRIILDGRVLKAEARWTDRDEGRVVYVGQAHPEQASDFIAVIDSELPQGIRNQLLVQLPQFMHLFAGKLGVQQARPTLYVSYDASHTGGWGRQGGVLPGQVFVHFYGPKWPEEMQKPAFADDLAWHFAHESAHLYQQQQFSATDADAWIHEGAAEAFAAMALRNSADAYVHSREASARQNCESLRRGRSVHDTIAAGDFDAAYSCGLLINLTIDARIRATTPRDGLYAVWRAYLARICKGPGVAGESVYCEAVAEVGGESLAVWVRSAANSTAGSRDSCGESHHKRLAIEPNQVDNRHGSGGTARIPWRPHEVSALQSLVSDL